MEVEIREKYRITIGHCAEPTADPNPHEQPTVNYASDEETVKLEMIQLAQGVKRAEVEAEMKNDDWTRA